MADYRFQISDAVGRTLALHFTPCDDDDVARAHAAVLTIEYGDDAHATIWEGERKVG